MTGPPLLRLCICICIHTCTHIYHIFFTYSCINEYLGLFHVLYIMKNICAAMNILGQISLWGTDLSSFGYIPISGIAPSRGSYIFNFWRNLHIVFHYGCTSLHSHQQYAKVSIFSTYTYLCLFKIAILTGVRWYHTVFLICIPWGLVMGRIFFFIYLLATCMSSFESFLPIFQSVYLVSCYWRIC